MPPTLERMYRIAVVCTGNICRSPMAELALARELDRAGLSGSVAVDSGGISDEEHGNPVDPRAARVLEREGLDPSGHSARQVTPQWRAFLAGQIARNRELYAEADRGIAMLPGASARCVSTARILYSQILDRIEAADHDVFSSRVRVPTPVKAVTAAAALVRRPAGVPA